MNSPDLVKMIAAVLVTGAFSTAANVIAVDVHLTYMQQDIKRQEQHNKDQDNRLRAIELRGINESIQ